MFKHYCRILDNDPGFGAELADQGARLDPHLEGCDAAMLIGELLRAQHLPVLLQVDELAELFGRVLR